MPMMLITNMKYSTILMRDSTKVVSDWSIWRCVMTLYTILYSLRMM